MNAVKWICWILIVIGGLNWGSVGIANYNVVEHLGQITQLVWLPKVVYIVVGVAALLSLLTVKGMSFKNAS